MWSYVFSLGRALDLSAATQKGEWQAAQGAIALQRSYKDTADC